MILADSIRSKAWKYAVIGQKYQVLSLEEAMNSRKSNLEMRDQANLGKVMNKIDEIITMKIMKMRLLHGDQIRIATFL